MASKAIGFLNFKFGADLKPFERAMNKAQRKLKKFGKGVERTGKSLTTGLTLPIVALGAASLKTFADFEQGMLKVKAISGATDSEFKALTESAKELGSTTMFTASQVAELQLNLSKLGLTPTQINQSTESILNLAQATDSDLGQAATVTAKIMNAFGMEATDMIRITDVMADAFSSTALDMTKFETAMASVAPVAKMAGSDLEQTSAILGVLVNNGVEASTAGTALRNIFLDLAKSGKTWDQAMGEINSSTEPLAVAMDMFGKRGANVATILAQSGVEVQSLTEDFRDSTGEAQSMADIMDSGVAGSIRKMRSQLEGAAIDLGEKLVPIFEVAIDKLSKMIKWFTLLSDSQQKNIVKWGLIIAAVGPILIIIGKLSIGLSALIPIVKALTTVLLKNPYIALAATIALVTAGVYSYVTALTTQEKIQKNLKDIQSSAIAETKHEIDLINEKLRVAKNVKSSDEDRKDAVAFLNTEIRGLNGQLSLENINEKRVVKSIEEHTNALIANAQAAGSKKRLESEVMELERLKEVQDDLFDSYFKNLSKEQLFSHGYDASAPWTEFDARVSAADAKVSHLTDGIKNQEKVVKSITDSIVDYTEKAAILTKELSLSEVLSRNYGDTVSGLNNKLADLTNVYENATKGTNDYKTAAKEIRKISKELAKDYSKTSDVVTTTNNKIKKDIDALNLELVQSKEVNFTPTKAEFLDTKPVEAYRGALGTLVDQISVLTNISAPELEDALMSTMTKLGDNLAQGAESFQEFGESVKGMMRDIIGGIISQGIATAITAALSNPAIKINPFLIPVIAGAAAGLARTAFNSLVPAFAEGGLVTGPTTALIGEGVGTNAGNPEVVAPLDKLKSMMGGGNNSNITVTGKLIGSDIFLSNQNASNNRLRTT